MLNYIWAGMILLGISAALFSDISNEIENTFNNNERYMADYSVTKQDKKIEIFFSENYSFVIDKKETVPFYAKIKLNEKAPRFWNNAVDYASLDDKSFLQIEVRAMDQAKKTIVYRLPEIHWVKLKEITQAAFDMASFAVKLAIGLAGVMALWLGLMRIAEKSGLIQYFVKLIYPLLHWLFPSIDKSHPVFGSISLNMAANVLGLGNAATPMGIKAMQQLQALNSDKSRASDDMCMFLAINTSSVQLLPPVTLIAIIGPTVSELMLPIIFATTCSTITAIVSAKYFARRSA